MPAIVKFVANCGIRPGRIILPMGRNAFFCCQRFNVSVDDVLHLSAAGVVRHCQNEVTAESITLAAVFFSNFYVLEMEVTALNLKTVLLLTILTVSVDIDVLDVLYVFFRCFLLNVVCLCLCNLSARFL